MVAHANKVLSHRELLQAVWGPDYGDQVDYLRVVVNQLRKKIEAQTVRAGVPADRALGRLPHRAAGGADDARTVMTLQPIDWVIVLFTLLICFVPALFFGKRAGKSTSEFFASGRSVPWWLAGLSMVATTFSSDTPNWVTQQVRQYGVAGNWQWWAFVLTGVSTVFFFARLVAPIRRDDRPRVLRAALLGHGGLGRARLPRGLSRPVLQLLHHGRW